MKLPDEDFDIVAGASNSPDRNYLLGRVFDDEFREEVTRRGYDLTTFRFTIQKDHNHPRWKQTTISPVAKETP